MKGLLTLAALHLLCAITVYTLLLILGGLRSPAGWLIVVAAVAFTIWIKNKIRLPWWFVWLEMKLFSILSRPGKSREERE